MFPPGGSVQSEKVGQSDPPRSGVVVRGLVGAIAVLMGAFTGVMLTVIHQSSAEIAGTAVPWGIIVALVLSASLLAGLRLVFDSRLPPALAAIGLLAVVAVLSAQGAGGSVIVPANPAGYVWTFGPAVIAVLVLAWPRGRPVRPG